MLGVMLTGCSAEQGSDRPEPTSLDQGLNILSSDGDSLLVAYRKDNRAVYFETLRGVPLVESYVAEHPEWGTHEMDARVMDELGNTLIMQVGGDEPIDPLWYQEFEEMRERQRTTRTRTPQESFELAEEALAAIRAAKLLDRHQQHLDVAARIGDDLAIDRIRGPEAVPEELRERIAYSCDPKSASMNSSNEIRNPEECTWWEWSGYAQYKTKWECIDWFCVGHHSAVQVKGKMWDGSTNWFLYTCNHGGCADDLPNTSCQDSGTGLHFVSAKGCSTPYDWWSGGGTHNCHDDSRQQAASVMKGKQIDRVSSTYCQGWGHWKAPGVNGNACY